MAKIQLYTQQRVLSDPALVARFGIDPDSPEQSINAQFFPAVREHGEIVPLRFGDALKGHDDCEECEHGGPMMSMMSGSGDPPNSGGTNDPNSGGQSEPPHLHLELKNVGVTSMWELEAWPSGGVSGQPSSGGSGGVVVPTQGYLTVQLKSNDTPSSLNTVARIQISSSSPLQNTYRIVEDGLTLQS